jgi:hypothetical protein
VTPLVATSSRPSKPPLQAAAKPKFESPPGDAVASLESALALPSAFSAVTT